MLIKNSRLIQLHAIFQILGVVAQAHYVAKFLRQIWEVNHHIYGVLSWVGKSTPPKFEVMLEYGLLLTFAAVAILAIFTYTQRNNECIEINPSRWAMLGTYELICLLSSFSVFWILAATLLPVWLYSRNRPPRSVAAERISFTLSFGVIVGVALVLSATSWKSDMRVSNDYSDWMEYTRMEDGRLIENTEFIRGHLIGKLRNFNPCEGRLGDKTGLCLHLSKSVFRDTAHSFILFPPGMGISYDWEKENLLISQALTEKQRLLIEALWGVKPNAFEQIVNWSDSADEEEFISKNNRLSLHPPPYMGGALDNHSKLYLPVLTAISQEAHGVMSLYGAGLTRTLGGMLGITGQTTFDRYFTIYWWAVYAYLILLTLAIWRITRNAWAAAIALALTISAEMLAGFDSIRSNPDFNPILHFPDLIGLMAIAYDSRRGTIGSAFIRASAIGLAIWWSRDFGLSLLVASIVWHLLEASSANGNWRTRMPRLGLESIIAAIVIFGISMGSVSNQADLRSFGIDSQQALFLLSLICVIIWARFMNNSSTSHPRYHVLDVAGIGALYTAFVIVFVLQDIAASNQALLMSFIVFPLTVFFVWLMDRRLSDRGGAPRFISYVTYICIIFLGVLLVADQRLYWQLAYDNENHIGFAWNFPGLSASSTSDPEIVKQSVNLINKYQPEGQLQFISKYDNWFRILTGRPDYFTYIEWRTAIVSHEMLSNTATLINQSNARHLFVEHKLLEDIGWKVHDDRTSSITAMSQVLLKVSKCYIPGEVGGLLQVWHRTCELQ